MDFFDYKESINEKYDSLLKEKLGPDYYIFPKGLAFPDDKNYSIYLKAFRFIFNLKSEESRLYLFNAFAWCNLDYMDNIIRADFSEDELEFLSKVFETIKRSNELFGDDFRGDQNINKPICTERLVLKPFTKADNDYYIQFFNENHEEFEKYYNISYRNDLCDHLIRFRDPFHFSIYSKDLNSCIGVIGLNEREDDAQSIEYFIYPKFRNKGYCFEAVKALCEKALNNELTIKKETIKDCVFDIEQKKIKTIIFHISLENKASLMIAEKIGATRIDQTKERKFALYNLKKTI